MLSSLPMRGFISSILRSATRAPRSTGDEEEEPGGKRERQHEAEVDQRKRPQMALEIEGRQGEARGNREEHADEQAEHPSREGGAGELHDRRAARHQDGRQGRKGRPQHGHPNTVPGSTSTSTSDRKSVV